MNLPSVPFEICSGMETYCFDSTRELLHSTSSKRHLSWVDRPTGDKRLTHSCPLDSRGLSHLEKIRQLGNHRDFPVCSLKNLCRPCRPNENQLSPERLTHQQFGTLDIRTVVEIVFDQFE